MTFVRSSGWLVAAFLVLGMVAAPGGAAADTTLGFSTFLGGHQSDRAEDVAVDDAGNVYVLTDTSSKQFPTTSGAFDRRLDAGDVAVSKLDPTGERLLWSTFVGGSGFECFPGCALALDPARAVYVAGSTTSEDFPTTPGAFDRDLAGSDVFVAKLDPSGGSLEYGTLLGGSDHDAAFGLAVDASGAAYVTGSTESADFPVTAGALDTTASPGGDAFVTKLDPSGGALAYSTFLGGADDETGFAVSVDGGGAAYVTGDTRSPDFPVPRGFDTSHAGGGHDGFVAKLAPAGDALAYGTFLGGADLDHADGLAVDGTGAAFVTGHTRSADFPSTPGAFQTTHNSPGDEDAFVARLDPAGASLAYGTFLGGELGDGGRGIAVGADGAAVMTGFTGSGDYPTAPGALDATLDGGDAVVTQLAPDGSGLLESTYLGGEAFDIGTAAALRGGGVVVAGDTASGDFPATAGAFDTRFNSKGLDPDAFVTGLRLDPSS